MIKKQTAVELLQETLYLHFTHEQKQQFDGLFHQALEIEYQQLVEAAIWMPEHFGTEFIPELGKLYYNENYGKG